MELPGNYLIVFYPKVYVIARSNTSNAAADEVKSSRDTFLCFAEFATNFLVKIATWEEIKVIVAIGRPLNCTIPVHLLPILYCSQLTVNYNYEDAIRSTRGSIICTYFVKPPSHAPEKYSWDTCSVINYCRHHPRPVNKHNKPNSKCFELSSLSALATRQKYIKWV